LCHFFETNRLKGGISEDEFFTDLFPFVAEIAAAIDAQLVESAQACRDHTMAIARRAGPAFEAELLGEENLESNHFEIRQLPSGHCGTVWLTQAAAAAVLACSFLGLCPPVPRGSYYPMEGTGVNFTAIMYDLHYRSQRGKFECLLNYFGRISAKLPDGCLTFTRKVLGQEHSAAPLTAAELRRSVTPLAALCAMERHRGSWSAEGPFTRIEDDTAVTLRADFANMYLGGGVLHSGCVQEEILFVVFPELLVGMLLCQRMGDREALEIAGVERFNR